MVFFALFGQLSATVTVTVGAATTRHLVTKGERRHHDICYAAAVCCVVSLARGWHAVCYCW